MVLLIIIPMKNGYFIGNINPTFSGPNPYSYKTQLILDVYPVPAALVTAFHLSAAAGAGFVELIQT